MAAPPGAPPPGAAAYALVVGSNQGGQGQQPLEFAEADARRVRDVLTELGRYAPSNVTLLSHPSPEKVLGTLDELKGRLEGHRARGEDATVFFYYSGHARANAMNLGAEALELRELRTKLTSLPTALTVVVLDACQSGAFSHVKGADRAADFSFNSVASLNTHGLAVMASSSSAELSQESERLGSSYFTNYLLVGLRGAGDQNRDGRVSLDEAYKYAYGQTLAATSRTAVGGQHVTLETELTGQGDVPMTYPASSTSQLVLPKAFDGQVLLQNRQHHAVLAELTKVPGTMVALAVPPSDYDAVVRRSGSAWECKLSLGANQTATLDLGGCSPIADEPAKAKGSGPAEKPGEVWGFDLGVGVGGAQRHDQYVEQLDQFGYARHTTFLMPDVPFRWSVGASRRILGPISLLARLRLLDSRDFDRGLITNDDKTFGWSTYGLSIGARGTFPLAGDKISAYGQLELGPALATTSYHDGNASPAVNDNQTFFGFQGAGAAGLQVMPWEKAGLFLEVTYAYAPVVTNLLGDTHDSGGLTYLLGFHARSWGTL